MSAFPALALLTFWARSLFASSIKAADRGISASVSADWEAERGSSCCGGGGAGPGIGGSDVIAMLNYSEETKRVSCVSVFL